MLFVLMTNVASAQQTTTLPNGTISGVVFYDSDGDGIQDPGEAGMQNVTVTISRTVPSEDFVDTATTSVNGFYAFYSAWGVGLIITAIDPLYTVRQTVPDGYVNTTPIEVLAPVANKTVTTVNFGNQLQVQIYVPALSSTRVAQ